MDSYERGNFEYVPCAIGFMDFDRAQWIQIYRFDNTRFYPESSPCGWLKWSPDGTQFICEQGFVGIYTYQFNVFRADGKRQFDGQYIASWSPDGQYVYAISCVGNGLQPGHTLSVYDADSWEKVCTLNSGSVYWCPISPDTECRLLLKDHRTLVITLADNHKFYETIYDDKGDYLSTREITFEQKDFQSQRYRVTIENCWLRVVDTRTGTERTLRIPGYCITNIAWSPN